MKSKLKVAAVQFPLKEKGNATQFFSLVSQFIRQAKENSADLVIFPELITTELIDWNLPIPNQMEKIADQFTPEYFKQLRVMAKEFDISILGGTSPRRKDDQIVNTSALAVSNGDIFFQDKIFLTPDEKSWGWKTGDEVQIIESSFGKIAILICFDAEFPIVTQALAQHQIDLILIPSWTGTMSGYNRVDWTSRARAIEHYCYVIKTGTVPSPESTQAHFGKAAIITPQEPEFPTFVLEGDMNQSQILYGEIDLELLAKKKANTQYFPAHEQKNKQVKIKFK